jgi:hypothetical protein
VLRIGGWGPRAENFSCGTLCLTLTVDEQEEHERYILCLTRDFDTMDQDSIKKKMMLKRTLSICNH